MQPNNLLIIGRRTSEMNTVFPYPVWIPFSQANVRALGQWTGLTFVLHWCLKGFCGCISGAVTVKFRELVQLYSFVKQSRIWLMNLFFFRFKVRSHRYAASMCCFCNCISFFKVAYTTMMYYQGRSDPQMCEIVKRTLWVLRVSVTQKVAQKCIYSVCWWHTLFFQELGYSFPYSIMFIGQVPCSSQSAENWDNNIIFGIHS